MNNHDLNELTAISPLDGRYRNKINELSPYASEYSLIKTRLEVEIKYLIAISDFQISRKLSKKEVDFLFSLVEKFSLQEAEKVKETEKTTRHDLKAVEFYLREKIKNSSLKDILELIHFGLTSEDINNISYRLLLKRGSEEIVIKEIKKILDALLEKAESFKNLVILGRTHGQPAVPTTLGKEIVVYAQRLNNELKEFKKIKLTGKLNGAIGNVNALSFVYPQKNWVKFSEEFSKSLDLEPNILTTQINPSDDIIAYLQIYQRINSILIGLNQDVWRYISDNWLVQEIKKGEIGSSVMPQKVNPIDFENSEGNLGVANSLIEFFVRKLPISRLQRDLSDSTVLRNIGSALAYSLLGYKSLLTGLSRIRPNEEQISKDLNKDFSILAEGVQTLLRKENYKDPYSLIASLVKGKNIKEAEWIDLVNKLPIEEKQKKVLEKLTPSGYIGLAKELTEKAIKDIRSSR